MTITTACLVAMVLLMGTAMIASAPGSKRSPVHSEMLVSTGWLQEHLADPDLVLLYVGRDRKAYDARHIPGSRFLPFNALVEQHKHSLNELPPVADLQALFAGLGVADDSRIVLYGEGEGLLAARAFFTLDYLGHAEQAALLDGGMEQWIAESRGTDNRSASPAPANFSARINTRVLLTTPQMREISQSVELRSSAEYVLLDARPPQEFEGTVRSKDVTKAGHIPGANSLYWKTLLGPGAAPSLLDSEKLQQAFEAAGATDDKVVVTYCRTGIQSSFTYFVARYLGYSVAMYDGSVYEWVNGASYDLSPN
jgi:thiosulfate/3-mercaptopyruvate sulfurtransferase